MATIQREVTIDISQETVFNFVVSEWQGKLGFWTSGIEEWTPLVTTPMGKGFRVRYIARMLGIGTKVEMEVQEFERPGGWIARSIGGPPVEGRWEFRPINDKTSFRYCLTYTMPPPLLGPLMDRLLLSRQWERSIQASLKQLKLILESTEDGSNVRGAV